MRIICTDISGGKSANDYAGYFLKKATRIFLLYTYDELFIDLSK